MTDQERLDAHEVRLGKVEDHLTRHDQQVGVLASQVATLQADEAQEPVHRLRAIGAKVAPYLPSKSTWTLIASHTAAMLLALSLAKTPGCQPVPDVPPVVPVVPVTPPGPVKAALIISVLHDATADTPGTAAVVNNSAMRATLSKAGHKVRVYEIHQTEYTALGFAPFAAKAGGLPAMVIQQADGTVRTAVKVPATTDAFLKVITDAGGF